MCENELRGWASRLERGGGAAGGLPQHFPGEDHPLARVAIYNLGEDNYNYSGGFIDANGTVAVGPGLTGGHAWVPLQYTEGARSYYAGASFGAELSGSASYLHYIPIHTVDFKALTVEEHLVPYIQEVVGQILGN